MSYLLPHLHSGYAVDQAILNVSFKLTKLGAVEVADTATLLVAVPLQVIHVDD